MTDRTWCERKHIFYFVCLLLLHLHLHCKWKLARINIYILYSQESESVESKCNIALWPLHPLLWFAFASLFLFVFFLLSLYENLSNHIKSNEKLFSDSVDIGERQARPTTVRKWNTFIVVLCVACALCWNGTVKRLPQNTTNCVQCAYCFLSSLQFRLVHFIQKRIQIGINSTDVKSNNTQRQKCVSLYASSQTHALSTTCCSVSLRAQIIHNFSSNISRYKYMHIRCVWRFPRARLIHGWK